MSYISSLCRIYKQKSRLEDNIMLNTQPVSGIMQYLLRSYDPKAIIITGSYADATFDEYSDLDIYIIGHDGCKSMEDYSVVNNVQLQVKLAPWSYYENMPLPMQAVFKDAIIAYDPDGCGQRFMDMVNSTLASYPCATKRQKREHLIFLNGLLRRFPRQDADSDLRAHLLLSQSLQIWIDFTDRIMLGSRKTLEMMQRVDPNSYALYSKALRSFKYEDIAAWAEHLRKLNEENIEREFRIND